MVEGRDAAVGFAVQERVFRVCVGELGIRQVTVAASRTRTGCKLLLDQIQTPLDSLGIDRPDSQDAAALQRLMIKARHRVIVIDISPSGLVSPRHLVQPRHGQLRLTLRLVRAPRIPRPMRLRRVAMPALDRRHALRGRHLRDIPQRPRRRRGHVVAASRNVDPSAITCTLRRVGLVHGRFC